MAISFRFVSKGERAVPKRRSSPRVRPLIEGMAMHEWIIVGRWRVDSPLTRYVHRVSRRVHTAINTAPRSGTYSGTIKERAAATLRVLGARIFPELCREDYSPRDCVSEWLLRRDAKSSRNKRHPFVLLNCAVARWNPEFSWHFLTLFSAGRKRGAYARITGRISQFY